MVRLHELYPLGTEHKDFRLPRSQRFCTWRNLFLRVDDFLKFIHPLVSDRCGSALSKKRNAG